MWLHSVCVCHVHRWPVHRWSIQTGSEEYLRHCKCLVVSWSAWASPRIFSAQPSGHAHVPDASGASLGAAASAEMCPGGARATVVSGMVRCYVDHIAVFVSGRHSLATKPVSARMLPQIVCATDSLLPLCSLFPLTSCGLFPGGIGRFAALLASPQVECACHMHCVFVRLAAFLHFLLAACCRFNCTSPNFWQDNPMAR